MDEIESPEEKALASIFALGRAIEKKEDGVTSIATVDGVSVRTEPHQRAIDEINGMAREAERRYDMLWALAVRYWGVAERDLSEEERGERAVLILDAVVEYGATHREVALALGVSVGWAGEQVRRLIAAEEELLARNPAAWLNHLLNGRRTP